MNTVKALSVLDGRYEKATGALRETFSEYGLIKFRVFVEVQWLKFLIQELGLAGCSPDDIKKIDAVSGDFNEESALRIKAIEKETNHDVKAVEYYIKETLSAGGLGDIIEWVHFACTSDDINNTAYALMLREGREIILESMADLLEKIESLAKKYKSVPMMSRTHGQPATPTTTGKEMVNFAWRFKTEMNNLRAVTPGAKMNGATGNFNAHVAAFPSIDWIAAEKKFISDYLGVEPLLYTTQINPNNYIAEMLHSMVRASSILIDLDRDMWGYISLGYFKQITRAGEVGSSTMPHKVNPIDFENSEGNLGFAISGMEHLAVKLLNSRFQRDLTDSTVLRNMGAMFGYVLIGLKSSIRGLGKVELNEPVLARDLEDNMELLAEPVQTIMRVYGEKNPYEKLKDLTRGVKINAEKLGLFIDSLENVPEDVKSAMKKMTPASYVGLAEKLVDTYFSEQE
jgi:adenylosuccinate lyase